MYRLCRPVGFRRRLRSLAENDGGTCQSGKRNNRDRSHARIRGGRRRRSGGGRSGRLGRNGSRAAVLRLRGLSGRALRVGGRIRRAVAALSGLARGVDLNFGDHKEHLLDFDFHRDDIGVDGAVERQLNPLILYHHLTAVLRAARTPVLAPASGRPAAAAPLGLSAPKSGQALSGQHRVLHLLYIFPDMRRGILSVRFHEPDNG